MRCGVGWLGLLVLGLAGLGSVSSVAAQPENLEVLRITPSGEQVPAGRQIVVQFNQPVVPIGRMERSPEEVPVTVTPDPGCHWRWLDPSALACQLGEASALVSATKYRVVVRPELVALGGAALTETVTAEFVTERPAVAYYRFDTWLSPGTPRLRLTFNQPVAGRSVGEALRFVTGTTSAITLVERPENEHREPGTTWLVSPDPPLPLREDVRLEVRPGLASLRGPERGREERVVVAFSTFPEPEFLGVECTSLRGQSLFVGRDGSYEVQSSRGSKDGGCDPLGGVRLVFSSPILKETLRDHLTVTPDLAGGREDFDPWDAVYSYSRLRRPNSRHRYPNELPVSLKAVTEYRLEAAAVDLVDEFSRPLAQNLDFTFRTDHRKPRFVLNHRASVLESGVDSHLPGVVTNLEAIEFDFRRLQSDGEAEPRKERVELPEVVDVAYRHPLPVRSLLDDASGAIVGRMRTVPRTSPRGYWFFSQVTSLQVHVKAGFYNSLVWVTDLATGEPVAGAEIGIFRSSYERLDNRQEFLATATTDGDGLARLPGTEALDPERELTTPWRDRKQPHLVVQARVRDQLALVPLAYDFLAETRGPNRSYLSSDWRAKHGHIASWGFTAQGIYRAGDTIEFKVYVRKEGNETLEAPPGGPYQLEVLDPAGKVVHRRAGIQLSSFGTFDGQFRVPANGTVGWHQFVLTAAFADTQAWHPLRVLVSDFVPAPFRVAVDLSGEIFRQGETVEVSTSASLHAGGPYVDADTRVTATLSPASLTPDDPRAAGFWFATGGGTPETLYQTDLTLDGKGEGGASFAANAGAAILYGSLEVESAVQDDRGKRIASRARARFAARDRFVGIAQGDWILQVGKPATTSAWVADEYGTLLAGQDVEFTIEWEETHAARVKGAGNAYLTQYTRSWEVEHRCSGTTSEEPAHCTFSPQHAGRYRLSATLDDTLERPVETQLHRWSAGAGRVLWEEPPGHHLQIEPEKSTLRVGETARYLIKNPFPGARALVTLERFGVIKSWTTTLAASSEILEFEVEPDLLPGFYLSVVVTSPRVAPAPPAEGTVDLGKPSFRIGYVRSPVRDPYKELAVKVSPAAAVAKPRTRMSAQIEVATRQGETPPFEIAVAVLDEAVLDLLPQGTDLFDPYRGLYRLEPLDVANYNLIKALIGWQKFEKKGADPGGGGGGDDSLRSLFKFVSYWNPALETDAEGRAQIEFELPDNLTGWRILAVAATAGDRLGLGHASFQVNLPTEIRPALPNQVVEGDTFEARFTVMNRTDRPRKLKVEASASGSVRDAPRTREKIRAEPFKRYVVSLPVQAAEPGEIRFSVRAGDRQDADALTLPLPVRRRASLLTAASYGSTTEDRITEALRFPEDMRTDVGDLKVVAGPTVLGALEAAFDYMRDYPYSCWEQVLSKGTMAAHYLALEAYLADDLEWPGARELAESTLAQAANFQAPNGGMAYWVPADRYTSPYLSAYTALVFGWLRELGYEIPPAVEERLHEYLGTYLRKDVFPDFYSRGMASSVRAVALAALAQAGKLEAGDLERHQPHLAEMDLFGKAHFLQAAQLQAAQLQAAQLQAAQLQAAQLQAAQLQAAQLQAAQQVGGRSDLQGRVTDLILAHAQESGGKIVFSEQLDSSFSRILHTELRTQCALLSALLESEARGVTDELPSKLVRHLTQTRQQRHRWENTQENLFCAHALASYSRRYESVAPDMTVRATLDGEPFGTGRLTDLRQEPLTFTHPLGAADPGRDAAVELEREGAGRLYYAVQLAYSPTDPGRARHNAGFDVRREYSVERSAGWVQLGNPARVRQGELVRVDLYVSLPTARNFVVLDDPVPGGLEPVNRDLATASTVDAAKAKPTLPPDAFYFTRDDWRGFAWTRWSFYHRELRHGAVRFYSEYLPAGNYHLSYVAQAIAPGEFAALPVRAEEMYDPDVFGSGLVGTVVVEPLP